MSNTPLLATNLIGRKITIYYIDEVMALSHRDCVTVRDLGRHEHEIVYTHKGKRLMYYYDFRKRINSTIVLDGWVDDVKVDSEVSNCFSGNACFNLCGESPEAVKRHLESALMATDEAKAKSLFRLPNSTHDDGVTLLYPEIDIHHAVIDRLKNS